MPKKMSVREAALYFGKHEDTIRRWISEGKLKAEKDPGGRDWWIFGKQEPPKETTSL